MTSQTNGTRALRSVPSDALPSPFPPTLPWDVPDLVGRDELLADAVEQLSSRRTRMLTLVGIGGVGKTRLAVEVSRRLLPTFAGRVVYVPLSSISDRIWCSPRSCAQRVGRSRARAHRSRRSRSGSATSTATCCSCSTTSSRCSRLRPR